MLDPNRIRSVTIVGGGSSGWLAASYLGRFLRDVDCEVTLVESANVGTIGVGEATIPSMVRFLRQMRIDEIKFMRACAASYKLGIDFVGWRGEGHSYWHAFGLCGGKIDGMDLFHQWHRSRRLTADPRPYEHFSMQAQAGKALRAPRSVRDLSPIIKTGGYAYHLDAGAMAEFLKQIALADGVRHLHDDIEHVDVEEGMIAGLRCASGRTLTSDLYIDCTGFAGVLIEKALKDPWVDLSHQLLCDSAVVLPQQPDEEMPPFTRSTALGAGWTWEIPLSHRKGSGYVYSSAHVSADEAAQTLIDRAGFRRARTADPRHLRMRVGHRTDFWRGNCVSVGLSSGFIEPLESTGLYFVHRALGLLRDHWPDRGFSPSLRLGFNRLMRQAYDEVRDFILLHYVLADRPEPFWRDAVSVPVPLSLAEALESYDENGLIPLRSSEVFSAANYYFILAGCGRLPRRICARSEFIDFAPVAKVLTEIEAQNDRICADLPLQSSLMRWIHRREGDGASLRGSSLADPTLG
ncbi:tryptophan 7-halogenase [Albimonas sp. CAU 1670]|uniref:tryptophan halogenase family protein n=1 Tax=Albimonas sp. CAU 1670 TaxID=3032599 RepID=UPI0023DC9D9E|nr:tryptophan halogenase family protein [Albimonas sp. CAU 1670]MDF2234965.1 tryptophan 7-halogenase [Albimonas sp. CAU 1670]